MDKWLSIMLAVSFASAFYTISVQEKAQEETKSVAFALGYQECSELDDRNRTIILMKKECIDK